jgi:hypothetical protein
VPQSFSQWQNAGGGYPASDAPFRVAETFGPLPYAHSQLDAIRMNWRRTPEATYPDGYLGTVPSRRGDRLMDGLKARSTNRPYTRGIHKGERIDARDYFWPDEFNLWTGIAYESMGSRFSPPGLSLNDGMLEAERYPTDRKVGPRSVPAGARYAKTGSGLVPSTPDPDRKAVLRSQAPGWSSGGTRGNPGMAVPYPGR